MFFRYIYDKPPCNIIGIDDVAIGAGIAGLGSVIGGLFGSSSTKNTNKTNLQIARETNATNQQIASAANKLQSDLAFQAREQSIQDWYREANYNSPKAQMERLQAAGLNPFLNMDKNGNTGNSQSMPQTIQPFTPTTIPAQTGAPMQPLDYSGMFSGVAQGLQALAMAKKSGVETKRLEATFQSYVDQMASEAETSAANAAVRKIDAKLAVKYGDMKYSKELAKLDKEINLLASQETLTDEQTNYYTRAAEEAMSRHEINVKEYEFLKEKFKYVQEYIKNEIELPRRQTTAQETQAAASVTQASAAVTQANAAWKNALNGEKRTNADLERYANEIIGAYIDETGLHVSPEKRKYVQNQLQKIMRDERIRKSIETRNPLTYVGAILGGASAAQLIKIALK